MTFVSHAQNFEDVILWRALSHVTPGTYIDIGAQDPERDSVSLAFYKAGWRGIHIEATPGYASQLRSARPDETVIQAAVTDAPSPIEFYEIADTGLSTGKSRIAEMHEKAGWAKRAILVPTVRLDAIFDLASRQGVHWLKIDVEGMEAEVLRSWGDHPARPWILVIEATVPSSREQSHAGWVDQVLARGYRDVLFDGLSRYFLHEDHLELLPSLESPANVFDGFTIGRDHFAAAHLKAELHTLDQDLATARAKLPEVEQAHAQALADVTSALEARLKSASEQQESEFAADLKAARDDFASQKAEMDGALRATYEDLADSRSHCARLDERCIQLQHRLEAAQRSEESAALERASLHDRIAALHDEALEQQRRHFADLRDARAEFSSRKSEFDRALRAVHADLAVSRSENARLDERGTQLLHRVEAAQQSEASALQERASLHDQIAALHDASRDLQRELHGLQTELTLAQESLRGASQVIRAASEIRPSRLEWLKLGLGLSQQPSSWRDLQAWVSSSCSAATADEVTPSQADREQTNMGMPVFNRGNPYLRASSLNELLEWDDVDFVRCAYVTILGRQPDGPGESHYIRRVREGHSKLRILWQLRTSDEARRHDPGIAGLDRALRQAAWGRRRLVGPLARLFFRTERDGLLERELRAANNRNARQSAVVCQGLRTLEFASSQKEERLRLIEQRLAEMAADTALILDRLGHSSANLIDLNSLSAAGAVVDPAAQTGSLIPVRASDRHRDVFPLSRILQSRLKQIVKVED